MCALEADEGYASTPDGARIFYRIWGKGPFALAMPVNWGADSSIFSNGLSSLEYELALVTFDQRGLGRSDPARSAEEFSQETTAHDAAAVADVVGLPRSVVIGHSSGGAVALTYALRFPNRVSHLILLATAARWSDGDAEPDLPSPPPKRRCANRSATRSFRPSSIPSAFAEDGTSFSRRRVPARAVPVDPRGRVGTLRCARAAR